MDFFFEMETLISPRVIEAVLFILRHISLKKIRLFSDKSHDS